LNCISHSNADSPDILIAVYPIHSERRWFTRGGENPESSAQQNARRRLLCDRDTHPRIVPALNGTQNLWHQLLSKGHGLTAKKR
jgi:hypothetical protein